MKNKRKKVTRHHGTHTHGRGAKKKARGKGHRGGVGMSGTGKKADQKKTMVLKKCKKYFGKDKIRRAATKVEIKTITLQKISDNLKSFLEKGVAKKSGDSYELDLQKYKIIGNDKLDFKVKINALDCTQGAKKSVESSGGEIIIQTKKEKSE